MLCEVITFYCLTSFFDPPTPKKEPIKASILCQDGLASSNKNNNNHFLPSPGFHTSVHSAHLVAIHHEVVRGDERFENHYPAVAGCALQQRVCQVGDADVQLIGAVDQVWRTHTQKSEQACNEGAGFIRSNPAWTSLRINVTATCQ